MHHVGIASGLSASDWQCFALWGEGLIEGGFENTVVSTMVPKVPSLSDAMVSLFGRFPGSRGSSGSSVRCENDFRLRQS